MEHEHTIFNSFRDLQNYTTLKHIIGLVDENDSFRDLQNYTTLKPACQS